MNSPVPRAEPRSSRKTPTRSSRRPPRIVEIDLTASSDSEGDDDESVSSTSMAQERHQTRSAIALYSLGIEGNPLEHFLLQRRLLDLCHQSRRGSASLRPLHPLRPASQARPLLRLCEIHCRSSSSANSIALCFANVGTAHGVSTLKTSSPDKVCPTASRSSGTTSSGIQQVGRAGRSESARTVNCECPNDRCSHVRRVKAGTTTTHVTSIDLATKVTDTEEKLRHTLSHELCHIAAWVLSHEIKPPHGE